MTEDEAYRIAWQRFGSVDHTTRFLTLQFFSHLHDLVGGTRLYTLDGDRLLNWNASKQPRFTAPSFSSMFASLLRRERQPKHMERAAVELSGVIALDDEESAVPSLAIGAELVPFLEDH